MGSYFAQWGIYSLGYNVKNIDTSGSAAKMTFLNYAFNNIYKQADGTYQCQGQVTVTEQGATNPNAAGAGTGGDAWADIQKGFDATTSVSGVADTWNQTVKGNFNQLKQLKAKYPNLKVIMSLGGWTWSKYFSAAAATDAGRKALVSSCVNLYIKGNYPVDSGSGTGGTGVLAGIFDGIDIDWEYPGIQGVGYNTVDPVNDKHNYSLLMQEFRSELDAYGATTGKHYLLTATTGAGSDKIAQEEPAALASSVDWLNLMAYDYHGGFETTGPTDFQANLYGDPASPNISNGGTVATYFTDDAVKELVAAGFPIAKLNLGIPFYGRGWTGVKNVNNGMYQTATGPAAGASEAGINNYNVLKSAAGNIFYNNTVVGLYKFDGTNWWSYDDPSIIATKLNYTKTKGMGGVFSWSLDGDDTSATLMNAMGAINQ